MTIISDVFLTTVKPLEKTVRAQDVQSCLYFVHVDSHDDERLLRQEQGRSFQAQTVLEPRDEEEKRPIIFPVRRKPVPPQSDPKSALTKRSQLSIEEDSRLPPSAKSRDGEHSPWNPLSRPLKHEATAVQTSKMMGPRPMQKRRDHTSSSTLQALPERQNLDVRRLAVHPDTMRGNDFYKLKQEELAEMYAANAAPLVRYADPAYQNSKREQLGHGADDLLNKDILQQTKPSLTLIRRYGDTQQNVSRIGPLGEIEVLSSGYSKFSNQEISSKHDERKVRLSTEHDNSPFRRDLQPKSQLVRPEQLRQSHSTGPSLPFQRVRRSLDARRYSQWSSGDPANNRDSGNGDHYAFINPWNLVCEFTIGTAGRSIKCKSLNTENCTPSSLSELRFNLPSYHSPPGTPQSGTLRESKHSSLFTKANQRTSSSYSQATIQRHNSVPVPNGDDEAGLDLSLGQEHAGGGLGGKKAKLGKLIISPEGMHMLDLLIAANIAMWWKVYGDST